LYSHVARALVPAASALMPTLLGFCRVPLTDKRLDPFRMDWAEVFQGVPAAG